MPILRYKADYRPLDAATLERWKGVPPAVAGDCMNRMNCMAGRVSPLHPDMRIVGHARTISVMAGDNLCVHAAIPLMRPGEIIVIDAGGNPDVAIIGEILVTAAKLKGVAGFVIDGAARDVADLRNGDIPVFASASVPAGPHKGFGGSIDGPISCGGVPVRTGDLILGDADGVTVVPLHQAAAILEVGEAHVRKETDMLAKLAAGTTTAEMLGIEIPEVNAE
ncbi:RraA family protein [Nisaea sediminum]|uniref:RraA family protein n=1 Tax=Nisaea sediminum TaxID=2775867 RepID=UPI001868EFC1|nr:RraA family protein [Nisaea sediminum]